MRTSQAYGINNTKYDEQGRVMRPLEVWSKYEHFGDYARSASRHFDESHFKGLSAAFVDQHGTKPTKAFTSAKCDGLKSLVFIIPVHGCISLDITSGQDRDYVE